MTFKTKLPLLVLYGERRCVCVCVCVCDTLMLSLYVYVHTSMYLTESEHVSKNLVELQVKWLL